MSFLNPLLLMGLGAAILPVLIHLFHRSRYRVVRWGAMHLLEESVARRASRFRIEQILLVVLRTGILGILALLMSRPVLTSLGVGAAVGRGSLTVAIVVDTSYSTDRPGCFDEIREMAREVIGSLGPGDSVTILLAGGRPRALFPVPTGDPEAALSALESAAPVNGPARLADAIREALVTLGAGRASARELWVLTDRQANDWGPEVGRQIAASLEAARREPTPPAVTWVAVDGRLPENLCVQDFTIGPDPLTTGAPAILRVLVKRFGGRGPRTAAVSLHVDGVSSSRTEVSLEPDSSREVRFEHVFSAAGPHRLEVAVEDGVMAVDDRAYRSLLVREALPVVVVDGSPARDLLESSSGFLAMALAPVTGGSGDALPAIRVLSRSPGALEDLEDLAPVAVVLVNVPALPVGSLRALERFVHSGGGLLIFAGDRLQAGEYLEAREGEPPGSRLVPVRIVSVRGGSGRPREAVGPAGEPLLHPALGALEASRADLGLVRVWRWIEVALHGSLEAGGDGDPAEPRVIARLSTGAPWLIEHRHGEGRVILSTTAADDSWSNLPARSVYVPLVHELVKHVASSSTPSSRNLLTGEPIVLELPRAAGGDEILLRLADGTETRGRPVLRGAGAVFEFRDTALSGFYGALGPRGSTAQFAVNAPRRESGPGPVDLATLRALLEPHEVVVEGGRAGLQRRLERRRHGLELWRPLLALVLVLVIAETLLVQRFERGGRP